MNKDNYINKDSIYYLQRYFNEVCEAILLIIIIKISTNNKLILNEILLYSILIGVITLSLEEYNENIYSRVKGGMQASIGTVLMRSVLTLD